MSKIVSDLSEVSSEELCLSKANLDLKKENFTLKGPESKSNISPSCISWFSFYAAFISGLHVARRSDRFWAGLSIDLVIEQVLMRSLKPGGCLTRERGLTEQQYLIWLLSMPGYAETNHIMQELTGVQFNSGEQNKDMSKARQIRYMKDTVTILRAPAAPNPSSLDNNNNLRNIMSGVNADSNANADTTKSVGRRFFRR